ncbi:MAG TPA: ATP-binding protein [Candidatus Saccharimonadales bacterium]|nr:ATP-binding protein [Candidatus Saccharimonadales bacterium]
MLEIVVLVFSSVINVLLGMVVYLKNPRSATSRFFALLTASFALWSWASYFSVNPIFFSQLFWVRLVIMLAAFLCLSVFLTFTTFPARSIEGNRLISKLAVVYALFVMVVSQTPMIFIADRQDNPVPNFGIVFFAILVILFLGGGIFNLFNKYRQSEGNTRDQIRFVILGLIGSFSLIFLTNFMLVIFFDIRSLIPLGPAFTLIFSISMAYAIIRHKLFDIKRAVARSVAYLLSLGFIGIVYGVTIFSLSSLLAGYNTPDNAERAFYIFLALLSAILYSHTKRFFDRFTNRIFYRDSYDPQQFLNELNNTVVENIELGILLRHATRVIQENIKSRFCYVEIKETAVTKGRLIGTGEFELSPEDNTLLKQELIKTAARTIVTDELGSEFNTLREVLSRNNIGLLVRMLPGSDMTRESMYYLILGDKKSGNVYNEQDVRIMEIIGDELLIAIQNSIRFEEIQQFNVTLQQRVSDATVKLQRTNKKLRELDETKDEFISMASHQLRTPLTSAKGYMSMVLEGDAGKLTKQQESLLNQAFVSSQRMVYLIADLLNVSRLKTGKFIIDAQPTDLAEVVEGETAQLVETAKSKKIEMKYEKPKKLTKLMLDETKVRQVVMNFIDNAIYYTPSGGHVRIEVKEDEGHIYFTVKDDGLGVPREDQKHLFNKFYRAGNARKARPDGTGLGLFMAKKVVDAQGGSILFESTEGKGSLFGFSFSKKKLALP